MGVRGSRNLTLVTLSKGLATRGGMRHIRNTFTENAGRLTDSGSEAEKGGAGLEAGLPRLAARPHADLPSPDLRAGSRRSL